VHVAHIPPDVFLAGLHCNLSLSGCMHLTRGFSAAGSPRCVCGVLDWHCLLAAVCRAAFREAACHDPAQRRSGLTLGCVHSFIHIGSQDASNSMC